MPVEERSLTSSVFLEETKSPEIGFAYQLQKKEKAVTERTLLASEDGDVLGLTTEIQQSLRVLVSEAGRRAGCGKSARPVR